MATYDLKTPDGKLTESLGSMRLKELAKRGEISPRDQIRKIDGENRKGLWDPAWRVKGLFPAHIVAQIRVAEKAGTPETDGRPDQIRYYKGLLDEGILTDAEFAEKKQQLLGLSESPITTEPEPVAMSPSLVSARVADAEEQADLLQCEAPTWDSLSPSGTLVIQHARTIPSRKIIIAGVCVVLIIISASTWYIHRVHVIGSRRVALGAMVREKMETASEARRRGDDVGEIEALRAVVSVSDNDRRLLGSV